MSTKDNKEMELLSAYIDNELEDAEKNRIGSFLSNSPEGRRTMERLRHTKSILLSAPAIQVPQDFLDSLELQAEKAMERQAKRSFWRWSNAWAWGSPMVAAAALLTLGLQYMQPQQISFEKLARAHEAIRVNHGLHENILSASHYSMEARSVSENS